VKTLAAEYGACNVLVNNVCPGFTATDRLIGLAKSLAAQKGVTPEEIEEAWVRQAPLRRVGHPEELANVVVFLASERSSYVTGVSLAVDGGITKGLY
jgi:3-oxoacyl-[acyl-carrier protein] reductase